MLLGRNGGGTKRKEIKGQRIFQKVQIKCEFNSNLKDSLIDKLHDLDNDTNVNTTMQKSSLDELKNTQISHPQKKKANNDVTRTI